MYSSYQILAPEYAALAGRHVTILCCGVALKEYSLRSEIIDRTFYFVSDSREQLFHSVVWYIVDNSITSHAMNKSTYSTAVFLLQMR